ncbi:MAG: hypothetical protein GX061_01635 [Eubacteriaceae bacterium]|nr:hypothetical protein [Eubacteriaceae bacterium]
MDTTSNNSVAAIIYAIGSVAASALMICGHNVIGLTVLILSFVLCVFFLCYQCIVSLSASYLSIKGQIANPPGSFREYKSRRHIFSLEDKATLLTESGFSLVIIRVVITFLFCYLCFYSAITGKFAFFNDPGFDNVVYAAVMTATFSYLTTGLRFTALPAFISYVTIMSCYFLKEIADYLIPGNVKEANFAILFIAYSALIFIWAGFLKGASDYSDFCTFECDENSYCRTDLFIKQFAPMTGFTHCAEITAEQTPREISDTLCERLSSCAVASGVVFVGVTSRVEGVCFCFYFRPEDKKAKRFFDKKVLKLLKKEHFDRISLEITEQRDWGEYINELFPDNEKLCNIISQKHIAELFYSGERLDREFDITFFVDFKNKEDLIEFDKLMNSYGLTLSCASFGDEQGAVDPQYPYSGEFVIRSYVSARRLEYLNDLLVSESLKFGCLYVGEWVID